MTTTRITSRPLVAERTADEAQSIAILLEAFGADPANRWVWPEEAQYRAVFPEFVRAFAGQAFERGTAYRVGGDAGTALWLPPDAHSDEQALVALIERTVAAEIQDNLFAVFEQLGSLHPDEPHWYLPLIGVVPGQQRKGYGAALLQPALEICDRDGLPAYLESSNPMNISLYQRHGFEVLATIQIGTSPPISPMLRRPR
jgi:ribosomal protein S18 acetylase RimI-like enzyme